MSQGRLPSGPDYSKRGNEHILRTNHFRLNHDRNTQVFRYIVKFKADQEAEQKRKAKEAKQGKNSQRALENTNSEKPRKTMYQTEPNRTKDQKTSQHVNGDNVLNFFSKIPCAQWLATESQQITRTRS